MPDQPPSLVADPVAPTPPDLLSDLPQFEQESYDIQAVTRAIAGELGRVENARQELIQNLFPEMADALLNLFEAELGVPPDSPLLTLEDRRAVVLAYFANLRSLGPGLAWEQQITSLVGAGWSYREHDPADGTSPPVYEVNVLIPFSGPANVPVGLAATPTTGGGTLAAHTYHYAVSSATAYGETLACTPVAATLSSAGHIDLTWTAEPTATNGYNIYRDNGAGGQLYRLTTVGSESFTDDGSIALSGQPQPSEDSSASLLSGLVMGLIRRITPAHLQLNFGYTEGFLIGLGEIGVSPL